MVARTAGRKGRPHRNNRAKVFARDGDICHLCGHPGAGDVDHLVPRSMGGANHPDNYAPAHGATSRCPVCHRCCNQLRGAGRQVAQASPTSRPW